MAGSGAGVRERRVLTGDERTALRRMHAAATKHGRSADARPLWQALYDYVGSLVRDGRSGRQIAAALGVKPQRVSQMLAKAAR